MEAAWAGGRCTLAYFNTGARVELKPDGTPVTIADREAEAVLRGMIHRYFPRHSILGEEGGAAGEDVGHCWILDPLDGTKSFIRGVPLYGTLVAYESHGEVLAGVIYLPALDEMIAAARGEGCTWNGRRCHVSATEYLSDAFVCSTSVRGKERLVEVGSGYRTWGDCYGYALVATGRVDVMADAHMEVWDAGPMLPILEEAGGRFTDWAGNPTVRGGSGLATNGRLHEQALRVLNE